MEVLPTGDLKLNTPPYNAEIENSVLGVLLIEQDSIIRVLDVLKEEVFYGTKNQITFRAILSLFKQGKPTDVMTVTNHLVSGKHMAQHDAMLHLVKLTNTVTGSTALESWAEQIVSDYIRRELAKKAAKIYYSCFDTTLDSKELLGNSVEAVGSILQENSFTKERTFETILLETLEDMRRAADNPGGTIGLKTNFDFVDKNILGLVAPDLTIIAARPGQGKTTLALNMALNIAKDGIPVGFFSFEMKDRQLMWKILSRELPDTVNNIRSGKISKSNWDKLGNDFDRLKGIPFHINDRGFLTTAEMKAIVKGWKAKYHIEALFIDYLQLISGAKETRGQNREAQVSANCRDIKSLAMECDIPVILLSQLSRQGANVEPELHHLRESGAIEQDADNVLFIHFDEGATMQNYPGWIEGNEEWVVDLMLKKCRLGTKGNRQMILNGAHNCFKSMCFRDYSSNLTPLYRDPSTMNEDIF